VPRGGESAHVDADLGGDDRGRDRPDPRDLIESLGRPIERGQMNLDLASTAAMSAWIASIRPSIRTSRKRWWSSKCPVKASSRVG